MTGVARFGKFIDVEAEGLHLVFHLARAGWLRWSDKLATAPLRPGKSPIGLRVRALGRVGLRPDRGRDPQAAGGVHRAGPAAGAGIATLGPDPLDPAFDRAALAGLLAGRRSQVKGVLRDQSLLAGVGNAYSDEILHAAKLSPYAVAGSLTEEQVDRLYDALRSVLDRRRSRRRGASRPRS